MSRKFSCFVISPIGVEGSETNRRANEVYEGVIQHVLKGYDVDCLRGDHNASSNHIGADVIRCIREADFCIVDISYPNCNVYYELGLADAMEVPVILLKEKSVDASKLPADVVSRKYTEYSLDGVAALMQSWSNLDAFVRPYVEELKAGTLRPQKGVPAEAPAAQPFQRTMQLPEVKLPMDLRPVKERSRLQEAESWELKQKIDQAADRRNDETQLEWLLERYRSVCGDADYVALLRRMSAESPLVWQRYLSCAVAWLEVDYSHCALDVTWLSGLAAGIEKGFGELTQYQQAVECCSRVLAISRIHDGEVKLVDQTGVYRVYCREDAYYFRGLCYYHMYKQTGQIKWLDKAHDDWGWLRGRTDDSWITPGMRMRRWRNACCDLARAYLKADRKTTARGVMEDALERVERMERYARASEPDNDTAAEKTKKELLETAYEVYLQTDPDEAERIYEQLRTIDEKAAQRIKTFHDALKAKKTKTSVPPENARAMTADQRAAAVKELILSACQAIWLPEEVKKGIAKLYPDIDADMLKNRRQMLRISVPELEKLGNRIEAMLPELDPEAAEAEMLHSVNTYISKMVETYRQIDEENALLFKLPMRRNEES